MAQTENRFAIIVPYRDRRYNAVQLILNLQWYVKPDTFDLWIVEQADELPFNRGCTINAGFQIARQNHAYSHYVFHDVDLIPQRADYSYADCPTHLCAATSQYLYEPPYEDCFGGVVVFTVQDFTAVNGFSNHYWGWGREDYDLRSRCVRAGLRIERRPGRFLSLPHSVETDRALAWAKNRQRFDILQERDYRDDGLSSIDYALVRREELRELPFVDQPRTLPAPVLWTSVQLRGADILQDPTIAASPEYAA